MSVPHRYDFEIQLCVNSEIKVFYRKLKKHKIIDNLWVIEVGTERELPYILESNLH